jgi:hypothetical protein
VSAVPSTSALVLVAGGVLFLGWFIWFAAVMSKPPFSQSAKDWLNGLATFGAYFVEGDEADGSIVPTDREPTTWHKLQGLCAIVGFVVLGWVLARYALHFVRDPHWPDALRF